MDDNEALRVLHVGVAMWLGDIQTTLNGDTPNNPTAIAITGEELTRQAWAIRNADPVPA
jgi:hypothetical protein